MPALGIGCIEIENADRGPEPPMVTQVFIYLPLPIRNEHALNTFIGTL